jgi:hypothetical protein
MRWAGHERPSRSGLGSLPGCPGVNHAERPTTSGTDCPEWPGERRPMPLTGRTTVTPDLKGCLEEVSRIAAGAGTQLQRHDQQKEPRGAGPLVLQPGPRLHGTKRLGCRSAASSLRCLVHHSGAAGGARGQVLQISNRGPGLHGIQTRTRPARSADSRVIAAAAQREA